MIARVAPPQATVRAISGTIARMPTLIEDIQTGADWVAAALKSSGYRADFSPRSLWEVDRFFDEHTRNGQPKLGGLLSDGLGSRLFALGAYIGEVVRRSVGGSWMTDDDDPDGEINAALQLPDGAVIWPVQRAMKRVAGGPENGIAAYGAVMGVPVGSRPPAPVKRRGFFGGGGGEGRHR
jgi:hypothetical protein